MHKIRKYEGEKALKRIKSRKPIGPDRIPIELWRYVREMNMR